MLANRQIGGRIAALVFVTMCMLSTEGIGQVSIGMSGGGNACLPNGSADCEDVYPLLYVNGGFEYRFMTYFGVGIDYNLSALSTSRSKARVAAHHAVFMVRGHLPEGQLQR